MMKRYRAELSIASGILSADFEAESQEEADKILLNMITQTEGVEGIAAFPWQSYWFLLGDRRVVEIE